MYLDHRRDRQTKIIEQLSRFTLVNSVLSAFFFVMLIRYQAFETPENICAFELSVLVLFYGAEVFK